mmetsp:Transcript_6237/g.7170  ORF Transcript_6237/g.7170 Transcript_6237/m.7170 type:complete len:148 (-) Transcript_6237:67-510(-)
MEGQSCHLNVPVFPSCPVLALTDVKQDHVGHDFNSQPFCVIPVSIVLCSTCVEVIPECIVEVLESKEDIRGAKASTFWSGVTRRAVLDLEPNMHNTVLMDFCVAEPGTFALRDIQVTARLKKSSTLLQASDVTFKIQHQKFVTVVQT